MELKTRGNLFKLAEKQLIKDLRCGKIHDYSMLDIIDTAIVIRKKMDKLVSKKEFSKKELRRAIYLSKGR